jgi:chromosome segregation ATPase
MPDEPDPAGSPGLLDALLLPLRLPGRVLGDVERVSRALLSLQRSAEIHLASVDEHAGALVTGLATLQTSVERLEDKVDGLTGLQAAIENRMEGLRDDLNTRLLAVEAEVREIRPPIQEISRDVQSIGRLLPDPSSGPLARLKDTLTAS